MNTKIEEIIVTAVLPAVTSIGQAKLEEVLQKFKEDSPDEYEASIQAGHAFIQPLMKFVAKTKTKIDDGFAKAIHDAIDSSALQNGIVLTEKA